MNLIKKMNPVTAFARALDAGDRLMARIDRWSSSYEYRGRHWVTA